MPFDIFWRDTDGKTYPAELIGYGHDGALPVNADVPKVSFADATTLKSKESGGLDKAGKPRVKKFATLPLTEAPQVTGVNGSGIKQKDVPITEFRLQETDKCFFPLADLKVNVGNDKMGPKWNVLCGVRHVSGWATGGQANEKAGWLAVERVKKADAEKPAESAPVASDAPAPKGKRVKKADAE